LLVRIEVGLVDFRHHFLLLLAHRWVEAELSHSFQLVDLLLMHWLVLKGFELSLGLVGEALEQCQPAFKDFNVVNMWPVVLREQNALLKKLQDLAPVLTLNRLVTRSLL